MLTDRQKVSRITGVHEVSQHEDAPISDSGSGKSFCHVFEYHDGGDASVGEPARRYMALTRGVPQPTSF